MREEAEDALAVVCRDGDDAFARHRPACVARFAAAAGHQTASVEINQDGELLGHGFGGRPDVQVEAIFAHFLRAEVHVAEHSLLHGIGTVFVRQPDAIPFLDRLRSLPPEVSDGRGGEGDAFKNLDAGTVETFEDAVGRFHLGILGLEQAECNTEECKG